jgi:hypothetical protein
LADQVEIRLPKTVFNERTAFTATAIFKTRSSGADSIPTTAEYKLFNLSSKETIKDWTTLTPAASISISVSAVDNKIKSDYRPSERMALLVSADRGLSTEVLQEIHYRLMNVGGFTES